MSLPNTSTGENQGNHVSQTLSRILADLLQLHGATLSDDHRRLEGLLRDRCQDSAKEIFAIVCAAQTGIPQKVLNQPPISEDAHRTLLVQQITTRFWLSADAADWAIATWQHALRPFQHPDHLRAEERRQKEAAEGQRREQENARQAAEDLRLAQERKRQADALQAIELNGEFDRFVTENRGSWDHAKWTDFHSKMCNKYGQVDPGQLGHLLERTKAKYWAARSAVPATPAPAPLPRNPPQVVSTRAQVPAKPAAATPQSPPAPVDFHPIETLFSFEGRVARSPFWAANLMALLLLTPLCFALVYQQSDLLPSSTIQGYLPAEVVALFIFTRYLLRPYLAIFAKRAHDLDYSAWTLIFLLIPGSNVVLFLVLLFQRGKVGRNRFGDAPSGKYLVSMPAKGARHSGLGVWSFAMALLSMVTIPIMNAFEVLPRGMTARALESITGQTPPDLSVYVLELCFLANLLGVFVALAGLVQRKRKRSFAVLGLIANAAIVGMWLAGTLENFLK
jgi:uncharacterized membrane protein YhaH (DUF805 family)